MTEERIVRSILVSAALMLGVAGCPPVPADESDAGVGGSAAGGAATGGSATGGTASVPVCDIVDSLPPIGSTCNFTGESRCDRSGNQCACQRGIWYCNNACPASQPTPATGCETGAFCSYAPSATCECVDAPPCVGPDCPFWGDSAPPDPPPRWICIGTSSCPANLPMTGQDCTGLTDITCDYPNTNPALHTFCYCVANIDPASGSAWTCGQSAPCPAMQPLYDLTRGCTGPAVCTYSTPPYHCRCPVQSGQGIWVCF